MKKIAIFPFCKEVFPDIKHWNELQTEYEIGELIAPKGILMEGKDAAQVLNDSPIGKTVINTFDAGSNKWELLIVIEDNRLDKGIYENSQRYLLETLERGKEVCYFGTLSGSLSRRISELKQKYPFTLNTVFTDIYLEQTRKVKGFTKIEYPQVPVVLVGGIVEGANVHEIFLNVLTEAKKQGVYITAITKNQLANIFGCHNLYSVFDDSGCSEIEKMERLNVCLKMLEEREHPDLILMEAPDALIKFNSYAHNGFGIHTYMLSQAITIDRIICSLPFGLVIPEFVEELSKDFSYRYGCGISEISANNMLVDSLDVMQKKKVTVAHVKPEDIMNSMEKGQPFPVPVYGETEEGLKALSREILKG